MKSRLKEAADILHKNKVSCVVLPEGKEAWCSGEFGIKPLMVRLREDKEAFRGCVIADKVVGKAAALLTVLGKADAVYGEVMSKGASAVLDKHGIYYEYKTMVPYIENRTHTGRCPMEETVLEIEDPAQSFEALERTIKRLMAEKA